MRIMAFGKDTSGRLLFSPTDEATFANLLTSALARNVQSLQRLTRTTSDAVVFRGEVSRRVIDAGDPRNVGWTFLVAKSDPWREQIIKILKPLAVHRGMKDPDAPLLFGGESEEKWDSWLQDNFFGRHLRGEPVPQYILMVGAPTALPFGLQSVLDVVANVGRVDFDTLADLRQYVDKIVRIETAADPIVKRGVVLFGPDGGTDDPTYFSREYMIKPLAEHVRDDMGLHTVALMGYDATKQKLIRALRGATPALVFTASHGLGLFGQALDLQKRLNGAICCQAAGELTPEDLFAADDVPTNEPFLEGSVFFQFACYGYGTPAESDYAHWLDEGVPKKYADEDFVAAFPKRLLAHPHGPIAFIGHLDTAFMHGFTDPQEPHIADRWHARIQPFVQAVERLLQVQPSGLAMEDLSKRFAVCNTMLTGTYDRLQRGSQLWTSQSTTRFVDTWIMRGDARNYMVFGDPAARLRIPEI